MHLRALIIIYYNRIRESCFNNVHFTHPCIDIYCVTYYYVVLYYIVRIYYTSAERNGHHHLNDKNVVRLGNVHV
jgi:hypothetical protein